MKSRWPRRLAAAMLVAITLVVLDPQEARADPGAPAAPSGPIAQPGDGDGLSQADRDFLVRVRLAGLFDDLNNPGLSPADRDFLIRVRLAGLWA